MYIHILRIPLLTCGKTVAAVGVVADWHGDDLGLIIQNRIIIYNTVCEHADYYYYYYKGLVMMCVDIIIISFEPRNFSKLYVG